MNRLLQVVVFATVTLLAGSGVASANEGSVNGRGGCAISGREALTEGAFIVLLLVGATRFLGRPTPVRVRARRRK